MEEFHRDIDEAISGVIGAEFHGGTADRYAKQLNDQSTPLLNDQSNQ
jgi:hypothetical protein